VLQVSDYLEFGKEDTQEEKAAALASVVAVGEHLWVKCACCSRQPVCCPLAHYHQQPVAVHVERTTHDTSPVLKSHCVICWLQSGRGVIRRTRAAHGVLREGGRPEDWQ